MQYLAHPVKDEWLGSEFGAAEEPDQWRVVRRASPTERLAWVVVILLSLGPALGYLLAKIL